MVLSTMPAGSQLAMHCPAPEHCSPTAQPPQEFPQPSSPHALSPQLGTQLFSPPPLLVVPEPVLGERDDVELALPPCPESSLTSSGFAVQPRWANVAQSPRVARVEKLLMGSSWLG